MTGSNPPAVLPMVQEEPLSTTLESGDGGGLVRLDDLGTLVFHGPDVADFLQGYLTTDTADLGDGPRFTAICNIKGRVICTGYAWLEGTTATFVVHRSLCSVVMGFLRPYLAFSRTDAGAGSVDVVGALDCDPSAEGNASHRLDPRRRLLLVGEGNAAGKPPGRLPFLDRAHWDRATIRRREVWLQATTSGAFLPQMIALDELDAVNFAKGCYLGQEVVARAQHRGKVKRRLTALHWSGTPPCPGDGIESNGREVGTLVAATGSAGSGDESDRSDASPARGEALAVLLGGHEGPFATGPATTLTRIPAAAR